MSDIVSVKNVEKTYADGFTALKSVDLAIREGEILALLGPNGAGKTTLISIICGIVEKTGGTVSVGGYDIGKDFRRTRSLIGLVPQELHTDSFETVFNTVSFSRGLFGKARDDAHIERVLKDLSLWEKRNNEIMSLSGGMKRRVMIAKALSHEPRVLFLDEPSAGVDVELRKDMWRLVEELRQNGVTIILTTHYIEEAEAIADRIAVISKGELLLVEEKARLMSQLGRKTLVLQLAKPINEVPDDLKKHELELSEGGCVLTYSYKTAGERTGITSLLGDLSDAGIRFKDIETRQSSLEDIFVGLVHQSEDAQR